MTRYKLNKDEGFKLGYKVSVIFIALLALLGIRVDLCIILGLVVGVAMNQFWTYWKSEAITEVDEEEPDMVLEHKGIPIQHVGSKLIGRFRRLRPGDRSNASNTIEETSSERARLRFVRRKPVRRIGK